MSLLWKIKVLKKRFLDTDCTDCTVDFLPIKSRHIDFTERHSACGAEEPDTL